MAVASEEIKLIIRSEVDKAVSDLNKITNSLQKTQEKSTSVSKAFANIASAAALWKTYDVFKKVTDAASDQEEALNKFTVSFGKYVEIGKKGIEELTKNYAMSTEEAYDYTATLMNMTKSFGVAGDKAAEMSINLSKLAADYASFNNVSIEEALTAFRSALSGESEPMKRFGKDVSDNAIKLEAFRMGLTVGKDALDAKTKALAAYSLIMRTSTVETGDMIRTSDGWANIQKKIMAQITDLCAVIGSVFLPDIRQAGQALLNFLTPSNIEIIKTMTSAFWELGKIVSRVAIGFATIGMSELIPKAKELYNYLTGQQQAVSSTIDKAANKARDSHAAIQEQVVPSINTMKNVWVEYYTYTGQAADADIIKAQEKYTELLAMHQWTADQRKAIDDAFREQSEIAENAEMQKKTQKYMQVFNTITGSMMQTFGALGSYLGAINQKEISKIDKRKQVYSAAINAMCADEQTKAALQARLDFEMDKRKKEIQYRTAVYNKALAITQAIISTANAVASALAIPYAGLVIAPIVAALGAAQIGLIAATPIPAAYEGGLIQGSQGGTLIRAGEMGKSEAIIPLENPEAREKLGGMGATYNISFDGAILANESLPERFIEAIDRGLYKLNKSRNSIFAEAIR